MEGSIMNLRYALLALILAAVPAQADPTVTLAWNSCTGPINVQADPGAPLSLVASVTGQTEGHKAFQVRVLLRPYGSFMPDAWRFDEGGCQGPLRRTFNHYSQDPNCPQFHGDEPSLEITDFALDVNVNHYRFVYATAYPFGIPTADPNTRYMMVRMNLDHTFSTQAPSIPGETCGGFYQQMCFFLYKAEWVDMSGAERTYNVNSERLAMNDPYYSACFSTAVPAKPATWGAIKNTYRN